MSGKPFFDTNIVVYAFSAGDSRSDQAENLLAVGGIISVQVLNEFVNVSCHKQRRDWDQIQKALRVLETLLDPPLPLTAELHQAAIIVARDYHYRFYDSLIIAAALSAKCPLLYSEDLRHGQEIEGLRIQNPFAHA